MKTAGPALPFVLAALCLGAAAPPHPSARLDPLTGFDLQVAQAVRAWQAPGFAIAVVKDGSVVFSKAYGVREAGRPESADLHTLFAIGSTTKAMTAAAIGMLVDEKKLAWDDPVTTHLPWFALKDPSVTRELTIRDLLTHRAGLPNANYLWYGRSLGRHEILEKLRLVDPVYPVRSGFIYQNVMYAAGGAVIEARSGMPWERFIESRIFAPLGMTDSITTAATLESRPNRARPHFVIGGAVEPIENASVDAVAPAGSIWSSVDDMAKWVRFLLKDGVVTGPGGETRLLSSETMAELFKPQTMVTKEAFYPTAELTQPAWTTYGLGWFQQDYGGRKVDFHTGSIDGMVAMCGLIRSEGLGVYMLSNLDHAELRHALMLSLFDRFLGRPARDWSGDLKALYARLEEKGQEEEKKEESLRVPGTHPSLPLREYAGRYSDPLHGEVDVSLDPSGQSLSARYGDAFAGPLEHWNFDTFTARWAARWRGTARASFVLDPSGRVAEIRLMGATFRRTAPTP